MKVAFRIYPLPNGKAYTEEDVKTLKDVEELFDYCQIYEATISKEGWNYLVETFGMEILSLRFFCFWRRITPFSFSFWRQGKCISQSTSAW